VSSRSSRCAGRARAAAIAAAALLALWPAVARADGTADEADLHFRMGSADFRRGEYESALAHFMLSVRIVPNRNVVFNIALAFEQLRRFADAHRYYISALDGETDPRAVTAVREALARITPNVAVLEVVTSPPGATIYIDRKDLGSLGRAPRPLALQPGRYRVIAELDGYEPQVSESVEIVKGGGARVSLTLPRIVGAVHVGVEGAKSAAVRVDDERGAPACTAPCDLELPPGVRTLYFAAEGYQAEPRTVRVTARGRVTTSAVLVPLTGSIVVQTDERGALVTVDGKPSGFTPTVIPAVAAGRRKVRVTLRGHAPVEIEVEVLPNRQAQPDEIKLVPLREVIAVSRYKETLDDAPSSVSIISGEEIRAFGYPTIADALHGVRGFTISNDRAYASAGVRGLGQPEDYGNRLLVLADGQSLNDNIDNGSAIGNNARVDLHDVDRIEVVRGPGSLLYGTGALAGVVNLVSRPRDEQSHVHAGFGVYDDAVIHGRAGFHYNLAPDKGVWASVSAAHSKGYGVTIPGVLQPDGLTRKTDTARGVDGFTTVNTAGRAWWGPVTAQWFYNRRDQTVPVGAYATTFDDPGTRLADTRMMAELRFEPRLSDKVELLVRAHGNRAVSNERFAVAGATYLEDYTGTWFGGEARLVVTPVRWLRLTGGGEFQLHPQVTLTGRSVDPAGVSSSYLDEHDPYHFGAGYLLAEASPLPWLRLVGGARVDVYSTFGPIAIPRAAVVVKPVKGGVLKLMGGRAFRAPSIYEQVYNDGGFTQARAVDPSRGLTLGPESIWSGELEYSQRFLSDWVALVAGYAGYVQGIIGLVDDDKPGVQRFANSPDPALLAGGDVEIRREFREGWMLSASYAYERSVLLSSSLADPRLVNAPEHMTSFRGIVPVIRDLVSLALRMTVEAPRRISADLPDTTPTALIADAAVSGSIRPFGLHYTVGVYNIADQRYPVPVSATFASRTMPQNGRTFLVDLTATYP
jgi:outer membrane receptor protein involved in Fe transport